MKYRVIEKENLYRVNMFSVFFKLYNRPGTGIPVAFRLGYTDVPYKILFKVKGVNAQKVFIPASYVIQYNNMFQGHIKTGSEECRFQLQNPDYEFKMFLLMDNVSVAQAAHYVKILAEKISVSDLYLRA